MNVNNDTAAVARGPVRSVGQIVSGAWLRHNQLVLDLAERGLTVTLFVGFSWGFLNRAAHTFNLALVLIVISETLPVAMILARRFSKVTTQNPSDWVIAFAGTSLPLLATPAVAFPIVPAAVCGSLIFFGILFQIYAKQALGRSFEIVPANRGVKRFVPIASSAIRCMPDTRSPTSGFCSRARR